jgi:hypothetical protein
MTNTIDQNMTRPISRTISLKVMPGLELPPQAQAYSDDRGGCSYPWRNLLIQ